MSITTNNTSALTDLFMTVVKKKASTYVDDDINKLLKLDISQLKQFKRIKLEFNNMKNINEICLAEDFDIIMEKLCLNNIDVSITITLSEYNTNIKYEKIANYIDFLIWLRPRINQHIIDMLAGNYKNCFIYFIELLAHTAYMGELSLCSGAEIFAELSKYKNAYKLDEKFDQYIETYIGIKLNYIYADGRIKVDIKIMPRETADKLIAEYKIAIETALREQNNTRFMESIEVFKNAFIADRDRSQDSTIITDLLTFVMSNKKDAHK
jgi:hypothetical protein